MTIGTSLIEKSNINKIIVPAIILKCVLGSLYKIFTLFMPINSNKVTFASFRSDQLSGNLEYIYKEISRKTGRFSYVFLFGKYKNNTKHYMQMIKAIYHLATSRYFFIDDYYLPVYLITPRKGTEIIQLWHAAGAFKKFGYSTVGKSYGPSQDYIEHIKIHSNYSKVIVSTKDVVPVYAEAFQTPVNRIYPLGLPRTDYFFETEEHQRVKERFFDEYPMLKNKKLVLYAPTFRGKSHQHSSFDFSIDFHALKKKIGDGYAILVHLHPYMTGKIDIKGKYADFVYQINNKYTIEEILTLSDMLITDYSSVIFDYSILSRPMAFYANDLDSYKKERDFYYKYEEFVPGPIFDNTESLANWIKKDEYDLEVITNFRQRFLPGCDGKVSSRIVKQILSL